MDAGETVYIPPLVWHYLEYLDDTMSLNLRFGRSSHHRWIGDHLLSNFHLQNIAAWIPERGPLRGAPKRVFGTIQRAWTERAADEPAAALNERMRLLYRQLYREHCDPRRPVSFLPEHATTPVLGLFPEPSCRQDSRRVAR